MLGCWKMRSSPENSVTPLDGFFTVSGWSMDLVVGSVPCRITWLSGSDYAHERAKSYERLEHPGGEAQVDFGTVQVARNGELV